MTRLFQPVGLLFFLLFSIPGSAQLVKESFTESYYTDNFESDKGNWKVVSNADNLFLIQDGQYILRRKNTTSSYSVFTSWKNPLSSFELSVSLKFEKTNGAESSAGLIFMAQEDGSGAFVFEINGQQQYRLKQLVGLNYKFLTGDAKNKGWVKSELITGPDQYVNLQVRTSNRNYDILVNSKYLFSFTELAYKSGSIGLTVGPSTELRVDQFSVNGPPAAAITETKSPGTSETEEVQLLRKENKLLRDSLAVMKKELLRLKNDPKTQVKEKHGE